MAVWIAVNVEYFDFDEPIASVGGRVMDPPTPHAFGWYQYGLRVGVTRLMDMFDARGLPVSAPINSDICAQYPELVREANDRDWVWLAHGKRNRDNMHGFESIDAERRYLGEMIETLTRETGRKPRGWLGPALAESDATAQLLAEHGLDYVCDWVADDQPFWLTIGQRPMMNVPYAVDGLNDLRFRGHVVSGVDFGDMIIDQFDQLYEDSVGQPRVMCIALHPHIAGQPYRARNLSRALDHMLQRPDVWWTDSDSIADWFAGVSSPTPSQEG